MDIFPKLGRDGFVKQAQNVQTIKEKICDFDFVKAKKSFMRRILKEGKNVICNIKLTKVYY